MFLGDELKISRGAKKPPSSDSKVNVNEDRLIHILHYNLEICHCKYALGDHVPLIEFVVPLDHDQQPF